MKEYTIDSRQAGQRADKFLFKVLHLATSGFIYKMIRKKNIVLNDRKMTGKEILNEGDRICIYLADDTFAKFSGQNPGTGHTAVGSTEGSSSGQTAAGKQVRSDQGRKNDPHRPSPLALPVLYEDEHIIVMNKPAGILSQKAAASDYSMNEWMLDYLTETHSYDPEDSAGFRPSVSNRLDRNTSGLMLGGKTIAGLQSLAEMLRDRSMEKYYRALVNGTVTGFHDLEGYLIKDSRTNQVRISPVPEGKDASRIHTSYEPLTQYTAATDLKVHLITGKPHQIRAHLASEGNSLIGDPKYGNSKKNQFYAKSAGIRRQMLHAWQIIFPDGRVFEAPLPEDFLRLSDYLEKNEH